MPKYCSVLNTYTEFKIKGHPTVQHQQLLWRTRKFYKMTLSFYAITSTNTDLLLIGPLGRDFNEIQIKIRNFSFIQMHLKMSSAKWRPLCPGWDGLIKDYINSVMGNRIFKDILKPGCYGELWYVIQNWLYIFSIPQMSPFLFIIISTSYECRCPRLA